MSNVQDPNRSGRESRSSTGTSRSLIELVRADDEAAWDRLVSLYAPLVAHWCRRWRLADEDLADVFQEVFQAVAAHIAGFRNDRQQDTFRGWLRTITSNKIHDHFRKQRQEPRAFGGSEALARFSRFPDPVRADEDDADSSRPTLPSLGETVGKGAIESAEEAAVDSAEEAAVERRLFERGLELIRAEFEPRTWQAFWRTAVAGQPAKEVAADLSMTPGAVRVAKSRVLHRLRAELGDLQG